MKKTKQTEENAGERLSASVRSHFTKEIIDQISGMNKNEMESLLKDVMGTRLWIALLKYSSMRTPMLDSQLRTINPITNPYEISWAQGCYAGVCDLETHIIDLNTPSQKEEDEQDYDSTGEASNGVLMG